MEERIEFKPEMATQYFMGYGFDGDPAEILGAYRTLAHNWHACNAAIKEHATDRFRVRQIRKDRKKIQNDMLALKVAIQLLVDTGLLGRGRPGAYCVTLRFILEKWLDDRRKMYQEFLKECDEEHERVCKLAGAVNIIHREGAPALMVYNGRVSPAE